MKMLLIQGETLRIQKIFKRFVCTRTFLIDTMIVLLISMTITFYKQIVIRKYKFSSSKLSYSSSRRLSQFQPALDFQNI
jgi:hypothetical protein